MLRLQNCATAYNSVQRTAALPDTGDRGETISSQGLRLQGGRDQNLGVLTSLMENQTIKLNDTLNRMVLVVCMGTSGELQGKYMITKGGL